jgi:hypothetical protein
MTPASPMQCMSHLRELGRQSCIRTLTASLLILPTVASAGWINRSGESLPDTDASKAVGDFGAQMIFVSDERELLRLWATPSETVEAKTTDTVETNGFINAFIVFGGCKPDASGNCSVAMRFRVLRPDGMVYAETPDMEVWRAKPAPRGRSIELSVDYLKIRIEPMDQLGAYTINAQVKDENSGIEIDLKRPFTASKSGGS